MTNNRRRAHSTWSAVVWALGVFALGMGTPTEARAETGYDAWLRYATLPEAVRARYITVPRTVTVLGDSLVRHIVEGDTVLTYTKPQIGGGNVSNYDPKEMVDGKALTKGFISLQSESHPVEFRKVELVDLEPYAHDRKKLAKALARLRHRN